MHKKIPPKNPNTVLNSERKLQKNHFILNETAKQFQFTF